ncbi:MAG: chromate transporter [Ktedonobacteraceae bacterium]|nr:chromate transporter [Ktedonobacteraceae bacterium]MBO0793015.1 chromate transporter [Ktedonobacteraceae bacterium]
MINPLIYFLLFLKAALFSTGGLSNLPMLRQDLLGYGWANEGDFGRALAIGQVSPGPNGLWVISLGYLTYGVPGAVMALVALTIPPGLVLVISATYSRIEHQRWVPGFRDGISLAVVAVLFSVVWSILGPSAGDWRAWVIAASAFALGVTKRVNLLLILALAGVAGYFLYR